MFQTSFLQETHAAALFAKTVVMSHSKSQELLNKAAAFVVKTYEPLGDLHFQGKRAEAIYNWHVKNHGKDAEVTQKAKAEFETALTTYITADDKNWFAQNILEFLFQFLSIHHFILTDPRNLNSEAIYTTKMTWDLAIRRGWSHTERFRIFNVRLSKFTNDRTMQNACDCAACPIENMTILKLRDDKYEKLNELIEDACKVACQLATFIE